MIKSAEICSALLIKFFDYLIKILTNEKAFKNNNTNNFCFKS